MITRIAIALAATIIAAPAYAQHVYRGADGRTTSVDDAIKGANGEITVITQTQDGKVSMVTFDCKGHMTVMEHLSPPIRTYAVTPFSVASDIQKDVCH